MIEQLHLLPVYLSGHLKLVLCSLSVGVLISIPLGVLAARYKLVERIALGAAGVIQTIPALALLGAMVSLLILVGAPSIGYLPAFIALVLYSMLPVLRNTVTGLKSVAPAYIEAANGLGMTRCQRLFQVELPIAAPIIIAGVRTATTWIVGTATLSTAIGATSLGNYIFVGLQTQNMYSILIGCIASALLAILLDGLVRVFAYGIERNQKAWVASILLIFATMFGFVGYDAVKEYYYSNSYIVIGAKSFTEQYILSEIISHRIEKETNFFVKVRQSLSSLTAYKALKANDIHVFVEYSGTIWNHMMHKAQKPLNTELFYKEINDFLTKEGISIVGKIGFTNSYGFAMKRNLAEKLNISTLSDLAKYRTLSLASDYEFMGRTEWRIYQAAYDLHFAKSISMDHALMYQAATEKNVDVVVVFTTDGHIDANDMILLVDDKNAGLPFEALLLTNKKISKRSPHLFSVLNSLVGILNNEEMRTLNFKVDSKGLSPFTVAHEFIDSTLIKMDI